MFNTLAISSAAAVLMASPLTPAAGPAGDVPPPGRITIDIVSIIGSGCLPGSAVISVSPDKTAFTVTYSNYMAKAGGGAGSIDRKNCQIGLNVHVPQGVTYAVASADYRGFASLGKGATALQQASYYFQGMPQTARASHGFAGPFEDNWQASDSTDVAALVYAPCGEQRYLNINTELRVNRGTHSPDTSSFITMDSTDGNINTLYHFAWKQCPVTPRTANRR